ncbi:uncharacterized protein LOC121923332 [Sceloporus undulatus]|uniref:uncharacterized protein LOC121923332 n=1 Tax=Sceloporus undulatus TaxID=8520 RepID=UPI001C4AAB34|nr:uncharacterized protein LOC121923332 [Sceloporus undulatus]
MASVREVSGITEDLVCPVCLSIFQDPRMLGCGHNFCLSCLESCVIPKGQHHGTCPECRDPFSIQDAVRNRVLANLSEKARLLKLEEGSQSGVAGSWHFCEDHEEPLKLFCSQDEAPVCVICRDLPQHQGHNFLPIKNAVNSYKEKLKTSLETLEEGVKRATSNQSLQQEAMEELENLTENLCGLIFITFEELREILNEREQNMMDTVKQMKEDNQADMERMLEYLKDYKSSHNETISSIWALLEESNEFVFLKEIKELVRRIQDRLSEENQDRGRETGKGGQGVMEGEESKDQPQDTSESKAEASGEEATNAMEDVAGVIVPVDPALGELEELLNFESLKDMLRSISIGEMFAPASPSDSPPLGEDRNNFEEAEEKERTVVEDLNSIVEARTLALGVGSLNMQTPPPSSASSTVPTMGEALYKPPQHFSTFPVPLFQPLPFYNNSSMRGWGNVRNWTPHLRWSHGRGTSQKQPLYFSWGQGRGNSPNRQRYQPSEGNSSLQGSWKSPTGESSQPGGDHGWRRGQGCFNKQRPQSSGGNISGQSEGGSIKNESGKPSQSHEAGQGRSEFNEQRCQSSASSSSGQSKGQPIKKEPSKPRRGHSPGKGDSGQGRGSTKKGDGASSESQGTQKNRPQASHRGGRGRGRGSGSAKSPQNK